MAVGLIFLVDEFEWIRPIVIQKKEAEEIWVCVDYRSLNNACVPDSFPTSYSDEVLENVARNDALFYRCIF